MEEEQRQAALESARGDLSRLEVALADLYYCNFSVFQSLPDSWAIDQLFPVADLSGVAPLVLFLADDLEIIRGEPARRREFLAKRVERRQVESLIQKAELKETVQAGRRAQGELDGWFLSRARRRGGANGGA